MKVKYVGCVYMMSTQTEEGAGVLRYANTKSYYRDELYLAHQKAQAIVEEVYEKIMNGEITFKFIKNFDKNHVKFIKKFNDYDIYYMTDNENMEYLCSYSIEKIYIWANDSSGKNDVIDICEGNNEISRLYRYGLFWYLIGAVQDNPSIVKRFWWFTKLDTMLNYIFNKYEYNALEH